MKKYLFVILGIILTTCLVACGSSGKDTVNDNNQELSNIEEQNTSAEKEQKGKDSYSEQENEEKVAVVYFSGTGNTRKVANLLTKEASADIF